MHLQPWLVSQGRARAPDRTAAGVPTQEGEQLQAQGGHAAREGASERVQRQRADFHPKAALKLVQQHDAIYHEDVQTANLLKNHHLARSISDAGWSAYLSILSAKVASAGRRVVAVPPAYTSQICSGCSVIVQKGLSIRWHSCSACGTSLHRDHNAAKNIERAGQALRGAVA